MKVLSKYRLELHWDSIDYSQEGIASLKGSYFTGPVLKQAAQLNDQDQLLLDMSQQHVIFPPVTDYYQATLHWKGIAYQEDRVILKNAWITGKYVAKVEKFNDQDWLLIDCKGHDTEDYKPKKGKRVAPGLYTKVYKHQVVYYAEIQRKEGGEKYGD